MIRLPQRSVTRFFIPLIDVLTLLFCIFLVMPLAQNPEDAEARAGQERTLEDLRRELEQARARGSDVPAKLLAEIEQLRKEKAKALQERLALRLLQVDPVTGELSYVERGERYVVGSQADARRLIEKDRAERGARELYYLILYNPRSSYPTLGQMDQYRTWFEGVALGLEKLGGEAPKGKP